ncbi:MAG: hypothetical protein Q4F27_03595, partial [Desulfovibrionaceae bacterium]|nr:hypothetical protein [Desulfovibrionaceae bacterium]
GDMSYLFITHDIQLAALLCDRILLLHQGTLTDALDRRQSEKHISAHMRALLDATITFRSLYDGASPSHPPTHQQDGQS